MTTNSADPIVREIHIEAEPETVFAFFTDPDKLTRWLATEATLEPWPGGRCLQVHAGLDPDTGPFHMQARSWKSHRRPGSRSAGALPNRRSGRRPDRASSR